MGLGGTGSAAETASSLIMIGLDLEAPSPVYEEGRAVIFLLQLFLDPI